MASNTSETENCGESTTDSTTAADSLAYLVASCKQKYADSLSVIPEQGDYAYMLKLKLQPGVNVNIYITDERQLLDVFVTGNDVPDALKADFNRAVASLKTPDSLPLLLESIMAWHSEHSVEIEHSISERKKPDKIRRSEQRKYERRAAAAAAQQQQQQPEDQPNQNQNDHGGMKTAADVIHRIQWDDDLNAAHFVVGYIDRFIGLQERAFAGFDWTNFAHLDPEAAAVPQHRIQHFKYRELKVWDRPTKLDLVFNSTATPADGPQNIYEAMRSQDAGLAQPEPEPLAEEPESCDEDEAAASDNTHLFDQINPTEAATDMPAGRRPTHYISLQLRDASLRAQLLQVQQSLCAQLPDRLIKREDSERALQHLHITLCLFDYADRPDQSGQVLHAIKSAASRLQAIMNDGSLSLSGLAYLRQYRVAVACLQPDQPLLQRLTNCLRNELAASNIEVFVPNNLHLTLLKTRPTSKQEVYNDLANMCAVSRFKAHVSQFQLSYKKVGKANVNAELLTETLTAGVAEVPLTAGCSSQEAKPTYSDQHIGYHVKEAYNLGGLYLAVQQAAAVGSKSLAFFLNDKGSFADNPMPTEEEVRLFKATCEQCELPGSSIVVHGPYVLAPGSASAEARSLTVSQMVNDVRICSALGIAHYNIHIDTHNKSNEAQSFEPPTAFLERVADTLQQVLCATDRCQTAILLETAAGQNGERGSRLSELRQCMDLLSDQQQRVGVCLDTCHLFAAGYDLSTPSGFQKTMNQIGGQIGWDNVKAVHVNDSKFGLGSRLDRHETIGQGKIGPAAFELLVNDDRLDQLPLILETPLSHDNHLDEILKLHAMVDGRKEQQLEDRAATVSADADGTLTLTRSPSPTQADIDSLTQSITAHYERSRMGEEQRQRLLAVAEAVKQLAVDCYKHICDNTQLHVIGGVRTGLAAAGSDLDVCLLLPGQGDHWQTCVNLLSRLEAYVEQEQRLAQTCLALGVDGVDDCACELRLGAVPVLRIRLGQHIQCDVTVQQEYSIRDSLLLEAAVRICPPFAPLCSALKHLVGTRGVNDAAAGYANNYTYVLGLLHYLQSEQQPPALPNLCSEHPSLFDGLSLHAALLPAPSHLPPSLSIGRIWIDFAAFMARFPFESRRLSIANGASLPKQADVHSGLVEVEDPFEQRNTARALSDASRLRDIRAVFADAARQGAETDLFA